MKISETSLSDLKFILDKLGEEFKSTITFEKEKQISEEDKFLNYEMSKGTRNRLDWIKSIRQSIQNEIISRVNSITI